MTATFAYIKQRHPERSEGSFSDSSLFAQNDSVGNGLDRSEKTHLTLRKGQDPSLQHYLQYRFYPNDNPSVTLKQLHLPIRTRRGDPVWSPGNSVNFDGRLVNRPYSLTRIFRVGADIIRPTKSVKTDFNPLRFCFAKSTSPEWEANETFGFLRICN